MSHLASTKQMNLVDSLTVSIASQWYYLFEKAARKVNQNNLKGAIQEFDSGARQVSPDFTLMAKADEATRRYSRMFGLDLRSRESLLAFQTKKKDKPDVMANLLKNRTAK